MAVPEFRQSTTGKFLKIFGQKVQKSPNLTQNRKLDIFFLIREELKDKVYTLLLGFGGRLIDWDGLEVPVITFLAILAAPPGPASGLRAGLAGRKFFDLRSKIFIFRQFFFQKHFKLVSGA